MTTHASPLGVSKRQAPPEGFTCSGKSDKGHMCQPSEDRLMWLNVLGIFILSAVVGVRIGLWLFS